MRGANLAAGELRLDVTAARPAARRLFLYDVEPIDGNKSYTRVWNTSCNPATNPAPDYGLSACSAADGTTPPWAPDMMGAIVRSVTVDVERRLADDHDRARRRRPRCGSRAARRRWSRS